MQVVAVGAVVVGREHGLEIVAGPVADIAEEQPVTLQPAPAGLDGDGAAVRQREAFDVDRVGAGMFAEAPVAASDDTAALIGGRRQLYARDLLAIPALGGGADNIALPKRQR